MTRTHGRALRANGWSRRPRLLADTYLRHRAAIASQPLRIDGPINGESFLAYIEQVLVPALKPSNIVIIDNLGSPKGKAERRQSAPPAPSCSPCRPIVPTSTRPSRFSPSSRPLLRKAAERTVEATWQRIGTLLPCFTPQECANYHAGYTSE